MSCPQLKAPGCRRRRRLRATPGPTPRSSYGDALPYPENAVDPGRRAGARHRRDPGRPRPPRDPASASSPTRPPASRCCCPSRSTGACGCRVHGPRARARRSGSGPSPRRTRSCSTPTPSPRTRRSSAPCRPSTSTVVAYVNAVDRHLHRGAAGAPRCCRGRRRSSTSSTTSRPSAIKAELAGSPTPALPGAVASRRRSTAARRFPAGPRHHPRRRRALHLRQHAARRQGHRRAGQGLPGVVRAVLQAGRRHRPVRPADVTNAVTADGARTARRTTTTTSSTASTRR